ncbi:sensor histidine kinase, partial [Candidatus Hydrogenedentota bacterium]
VFESGQFRDHVSTANGLPVREVLSVAQLSDGAIVVGTAAGGAIYAAATRPVPGDVEFQPMVKPEFIEGRAITAIAESAGGVVALGMKDAVALWHRRDIRDTVAPDTLTKTTSNEKGIVHVAFAGRDPWNRTSDDSFEFSWRVDGGEWTDFSSKAYAEVNGLSLGSHELEVRARDLWGNVDPSPAQHLIEAIGPFYRQTWFQLIALLAASIAIVPSLVLAHKHRQLVIAKDLVDSTTRDLSRALRDLTRANERLAELDHLKSEFVSNVTHDLKTPLTSILGLVDNMLDGIGGEPSEKHRSYLERIRKSSERLKKMIEDILDLSRIEAGAIMLSPTSFDLAELMNEVAESLLPLVEKKNIKLCVESKSNSTEMTADRDRITQILVNLVGNAIKFTPGGGKIKIVGEIKRTGAAMIMVEDTGPGIDESMQTAIFDRFRTISGANRGAAESTGLGLAITKSLVELHGGKIWVENAAAGGCRIIGELPAPQTKREAL